MSKLVWFIGFIFICMSCSNDLNGPEDDNIPNLRVLSAEEQSLAASSNEFVFDLFRALEKRDDGKNIFFSPLSVQYALSMALNGANEATYDSIKSTLCFDDLNEQEINEAFQSLTEFLLNVDSKVLLTIANSIWYEEKLTVEESFKQAMQLYYKAEVAGLNFKSSQSVNVINDWVKENTNGLIDKLIDEIPPETVMYLINAIYFKADWKIQFDEADTKSGPFYPETGGEIEAQMMHSDDMEVMYYASSNMKMIEIPYGNGQYSMVIMLPAEGKKTGEIVDLLDRNIFNEWIGASELREIKLIMPKFKIEYEALLNEALSKMGMGIAFTDLADLSRLFEEPYDLFISRVIHKAVIEVNEEGTKAAAVTGVEVGLTSLPPERLVLVLDRPYLFFIREKHSGSVLFAGKLTDPTSEQ